jgi:hypothetical protein
MRRNQKAILFVVCVFILPTFAVTGAIYAFFDYKSPSVGSYEVEPGDRVTVTKSQFEGVRSRIATFYGNSDYDTVWLHLVLLREAQNAGIVVSDDEVARSATQNLGATSPEDYRQKLASRRMSPASWETTIRELIAISRYQSMMIRAPRVLEADVYDRFKRTNQKREFEYVTFAREDFLPDIDAPSFTSEEVQAWWKLPKNSLQRQKKQLPARYEVEIVGASIADFDPSPFQERFEAIEVTDAEIAAVHADPLQRIRFEVKTEGDESEAEDEDSGTDAEGDDEVAALRPLEEVREDIVRGLRLRKLLEDLIVEAEAEAGDAPVDLAAFSEKHGLSFEHTEPMASDALPIDPTGVAPATLSDVRSGPDGSAYFLRVVSLAVAADPPFEDIEEEVRVLFAEDKAYDAMLARAEKLFDTLKKATEKALDPRMPDFVRKDKEEAKKRQEAQEKEREEAKKRAEEARKKAEEDAKAAEGLAEGETGDEQNAADEAMEEDEDPAMEEDEDPAMEEDEDPAMDAEPVAEESPVAEKIEEALPPLTGIEPTDTDLAAVTDVGSWDKLVNKSLGAAFEQIIPKEGLTVERLGPSRKLRPGTEAYEEIESDAERFLLVSGPLASLGEGTVKVLPDAVSRERVFLVHVARVLDPEYSEMTAEERDNLVNGLRLEQERQLAFTLGVYARQYPQAASMVLDRARLETDWRTQKPETRAPR